MTRVLLVRSDAVGDLVLTLPVARSIKLADPSLQITFLASRYAAPLTIWPFVALLYLLLTFPLTRVAQYLEQKWRPVTRS